MPEPRKLGTRVIDKLRIQGSSASLGDPTLRRTNQRIHIDACDTPKHFAFHQATNNIGKVRRFNSPNVSHPNSAPSRKQSFLQRVRQANKGLSSYEYSSYPSDYIADKNNVHFLLQGKPVSGDLDQFHSSELSHKRVGHFKTSTTEQYRSRHRFRDMSDFYPDSSGLANSSAISHNDDFFYLGPDASPVPNALHPNRKSLLFLPNSAPGEIKGHNSTKTLEKEILSSYENKSLISEGTFVLPDHENDNKRERADSEHYDTKPVPHPTPIPFKRRNTKSRMSVSEQSSARPPDPTLLNQCLHVQQPSDTQESETAEEIHRYNKGFRGKPTPARNVKSFAGNQKSVGATDNNVNKYLFNSVESYVHFNKIYPQVDPHSSSSIAAKGVSSKGRLAAHFPRMEGFSPHCTDTLLLKMMFEMNKPTRSVKSISKYSDVAVHKDLDEFMVVGTPSPSRSVSVNSSGLGLGASMKSREKLTES